MLRSKQDEDELELVDVSENDEGDTSTDILLNSRQKSTTRSLKDLLSLPVARRSRVGCAIGVLFLGCFLLVLVPLVTRKPPEPFRCTGDATHLYDPQSGEFKFCHRGTEKILGFLGVDYQATGVDFRSQVDIDRYTYSNDAQLSLTFEEVPNSPEDGCVDVKWTGPSSQRAPLQDCYNMTGAKWFAGHTPYYQSWPLNTSNYPMVTPFLPNDSYTNRQGFGSVIHPVWLNTRGAAIFVKEKTQLHVSINASQLCLQALPYPLLCSPDAEQMTRLEYRVCGFINIKDAAVHFLHRSQELRHPPHPPHKDMFKHPVWSSWVRYKQGVTQANLTSFLAEIVDRGFPISNFEIDDRYSVNYGELIFDTDKFPDITNLTRSDTVTNNNITVSAWVHMFVDYSAPAFKDGLERGAFYPGGLSNTRALVNWWNGVAAVINFESETAKDWFRERLSNFSRNYSISSFKFDAGEANYLPECLYYPNPQLNGSFTAQYAAFAASSSFGSPSRVEVRVGHYTQHLPVMVRMIDRNSRWGKDNGLHSVLITALSMGLMGYPFILPDMIGGNAYANEDINHVGSVDVELYVRWMQLVTFLPSMQFSIPPWDPHIEKQAVDMCNEPHNARCINVTQHAKYLVDLHASIVDAYIYPLAEEVSKNGYPIIRPLWWIDDQAAGINDQFLIGDELMVAPVIQPNVTSRYVYFPAGSNWRSRSDGEVYSGNHTIPVNLTTILWFEKHT